MRSEPPRRAALSRRAAVQPASLGRRFWLRRALEHRAGSRRMVERSSEADRSPENVRPARLRVAWPLDTERVPWASWHSRYTPLSRALCGPSRRCNAAARPVFAAPRLAAGAGSGWASSPGARRASSVEHRAEPSRPACDARYIFKGIAIDKSHRFELGGEIS